MLSLLCLTSFDRDSSHRDLPLEAGGLAPVRASGLQPGIRDACDGDERAEQREHQGERRAGECPDEHRSDHRREYRDDRETVWTGTLRLMGKCQRLHPHRHPRADRRD